MTSKYRIGPLLGLSAVLTGILGLEIAAGPFFVPEPPAAPGSTAAVIASSSEPPPAQPDISTFADVIGRPLFAESRRPSPPKSTQVAVSEPKPESLDLIGVVISAKGRLAFLRAPATSEVTRAVEGQSVGGWEVSDIKPTQVLLRRGEDSETIRINDAAAAAADNSMGSTAPNLPVYSPAGESSPYQASPNEAASVVEEPSTSKAPAPLGSAAPSSDVSGGAVTE